MKVVILVTDVVIRFRLAAIEQAAHKPQTWEQQVMTIQQVADILLSLNCLDPSAATLLLNASTTITPQPGLTTVPLADFVPLIELVYPESEPTSLEAQQGHMLVAQAETTEETLASLGFVAKVEGFLQ